MERSLSMLVSENFHFPAFFSRKSERAKLDASIPFFCAVVFLCAFAPSFGIRTLAGPHCVSGGRERQ